MAQAQRPMWKGFLQVNLLHVPVKLYSAVRAQRVPFRMLHDQDLAPINQRLWCPLEEKQVGRDEVIKGYEIRKGQYILVTPEEMEKLRPAASREIRVEQFVDSGAIDPVYFDRPYYLGPDTGGEKSYELLCEALLKTRTIGICRFVMRNNEYLAALSVRDKHVLYLETLHHHNEVLAPEPGVDLSRVTFSKPEMNLTEQLVNVLAGEFDPKEYEDEFATKVMDLIQRKAGGEDVPLPAPDEEPAATESGDLASVLRAGLQQLKKQKPTTRGKTLRRGDELHDFPAERASGKAKSHASSHRKGHSARRAKIEDVLEPGRAFRPEDLPL